MSPEKRLPYTNAELEAALREGLSVWGERRLQAARDRETASTELRSLVQQAVAQGIGTGEIARIAQLSRQAVYDLMK